ncbi:MAG TPA: lipopolysaccharide biosynthesis protein [Pseudolabrys sp.]
MAQADVEHAPLRASVLQGALVRLRGMMGGQGDHAVTTRVAGAAYVIRVASAGAVYFSQIVLARWMSNAEFGIYVYVWTWVLLAADVIHLGLPLAAQRLIPAYKASNDDDRLRGFLFGSWRVVLALAIAGAALAAGLVTILKPHLAPAEIAPLYLACLALPFVSICIQFDGIARSYNWIGLALTPHFFWRPFLIVALVGAAVAAGIKADAVTVMAAIVLAAAATSAVHLVVLMRRLASVVPAGVRRYEIRSWLSTSTPMILVWGFYTLLTYTDVIMLQQFRPPEDVAHYYGAARTLMMVSFVAFSVSAAAAHRFSSYHLAGDHEGLAGFVAKTVRWTFWPSLLATVAILALGWPLLRLFGPSFVGAYPAMFVLALGPLARASVGPAERLLTMAGSQRACALVYAAAFTVNLIGCALLIPYWGILGAAVATSAAMVFESVALFVVVRHRLGIHAFAFSRAASSPR